MTFKEREREREREKWETNHMIYYNGNVLVIKPSKWQKLIATKVENL